MAEEHKTDISIGVQAREKTFEKLQAELEKRKAGLSKVAQHIFHGLKIASIIYKKGVQGVRS